MAVREKLITDKMWEKLLPLLPELPKSKKGGRPWADNRKVFEGILWILRTGARWKDLPEEFPSPATCWRRLKRWEEEGVWLDLWRTYLKQLDERKQLKWSECFMDGSFAPAKKRGDAIGKTKRGKGTEWMVVVDGKGVPLGNHLDSASPAEVTLIIKTMKKVSVPRSGRGAPKQKPDRLIYDKAAGSDQLRLRLGQRGIELIVPHRRNRNKNKLQDGRKLRRYRRRWIVERTFAWLANIRRLVTRYERNLMMYNAFFNIACMMITLRQL